MPFNVILPEGVHAYDMTVTDIGYNNSKNEYTCTMRAIAGPGETLKGGTPAIIKGNEGTLLFNITMSDNGAIGPVPQSLLKGNFVESSLPQNTDMKKLIFSNEGEKIMFKAFDGSKDIAANQCWVECEMLQAGELTINFDNSTAIHKNPYIQENKSKNIYDIAGKRLDNPQKGINIIDNKKVLVK
jgi:hypothetical protein